MKTRLLIIIAILVVLFPLVPLVQYHISNQVMADGMTVSGSTVWLITIVFSMISWFLFAWASKSIKVAGITLSIISAAVLIIPFHDVLGPMASVIVGVVAGLVAFMLQKKMIDPTQNKSLKIAIITIVVSYFVLIMLVLTTQTNVSWDTGDGIGSWTGTEGMETGLYIGGGAIDVDPDLSPSYAYGFLGGLFYRTILPLAGYGVGISALFLVPHFILKRKNIPSKPYLSIILIGLLLFFGIPSFASTLQFFAIMLSQPESIHIWVFNPRFVLHLIPIIVLVISGILLYRSSVIKKLIKK